MDFSGDIGAMIFIGLLFLGALASVGVFLYNVFSSIGMSKKSCGTGQYCSSDNLLSTSTVDCGKGTECVTSGPYGGRVHGCCKDGKGTDDGMSTFDIIILVGSFLVVAGIIGGGVLYVTMKE